VIKRLFITLLAALSLALPLTGCASPEQQAAESVEPLKIGLLPLLEYLPYYVAEENGYFEDAGVEVEGLTAASSAERDQLMQAGEIDAMVHEMTSTAVFNRDEVTIQNILITRGATPDHAMFRILSAPGSDITSPADLAGVPVAVAENTIMEYVTVRLLEAEGLSSDEIVLQSVPIIVERFQLLVEGQVQAAILPDPLATAALQAGANLVVDDTTHTQYSLGLLTFSVDAIENNTEAVRRFVTAWNRAVEELNANPDGYRALFLEKVQVPESVQDTYELPTYQLNAIPTEAQWDDGIDWLLEKGLLDERLPYSGSINPEFITDN
jgi:NitT/TauT family transport system substrate-binding protein